MNAGDPGSGARAEVSVVIPCFNQARYLGEAIESVVRQTHGGAEIVVVDDGSSDATVAVAAAYPGVRCLSQANAGLSAARNAGLAASHGEFLVFLDADDRLLPEAVELGLKQLRLHPDCVFVSGHYRYIDSDGSLLLAYPQEPLTDSSYRSLLRRNYIGMHATVMYRRAIFDAVGAFSPAMRSCEDYELYLRITREHAVHAYGDFVAEYRMHGQSMSIDAATMLAAGLAALETQLPYVDGDREAVRALRDGVRYLRQNVRRPLLAELRKAALGVRPARTASLLAGLARYLPAWVRARHREFRLSAALGK